MESLKDVEEQLATICGEDNYNTILQASQGLMCEEGGVNVGKLWKLERKLRGIVIEPPTAMLDPKGNLVTTKSGIEKLTVETYQERLKPWKIKDELKMYQMQRKHLCDKRSI